MRASGQEYPPRRAPTPGIGAPPPPPPLPRANPSEPPATGRAWADTVKPPPAAIGGRDRGTERVSGGPQRDPPPSPRSPPRACEQPEAGQGDAGPASPPLDQGSPPPPPERAAAHGEGRHWARTLRAPRSAARPLPR